MSASYLASIILALVAASSAVTGFLIQRGHHDLIAGFDASKVIDADGLARSVGRGGVLLGGAFLVSAALVLVFPNWLVPIVLAMSLAALVATGRSCVVCSRHIRRQ
jgi:hypothetical protein